MTASTDTPVSPTDLAHDMWPLLHAMLPLIAVSFVVLGVSWTIRRMRNEWKSSDDFDVKWCINLGRHDAWVRNATPEAFEVHKRLCGRCSGAAFRANQFTMPAGVADAFTE